MKARLYGYPAPPKAGLGNMLIPWADCLLWCRDNDAQMLSPSWTRLRLGPMLRRERDKRLYHRLFDTGDAISGWRRVVLLASLRKVSSEAWRAGAIESFQGESTIVCFSDMRLFGNLIGKHTEVHSALYRITRPGYYPTDLPATPFVGIHVRLGDYRPSPRDGGFNAVFYRLPLVWYAGCLQEMRQAVGSVLPAIVFSDGTDEELAPLLQLPAVVRSPYRQAITDMLALAQSVAIITSRSTFSLWGSYLSQAPSVWYPKKSDVCGEGVMAAGKDADLEIEWMPGDPLPAGFIDALHRRVANWERYRGTLPNPERR